MSLALPQDGRINLRMVNNEIWRRHPKRFIEERLGAFFWSKQIDVINSVRDNRRTAVHSCHGSGKSYSAAQITAWWLEVHPIGSAFVVTSAPTAPQVKAILWREIGRTHSENNLIGRTNQTEWHVTTAAGHEELVAFGRKPSAINPTAFQGIHARYVLVIFDEACGIPVELWDAADSLISNADSRFLCIGNPDDPRSEFAEVCKSGSDWNTIRINAFDTPNFTGEWVPDHVRHLLVSPTWEVEKAKKWGVKSAMYTSKLLGLFPDIQEDGLIPIKWIREAQERVIPPTGNQELGVDVGGGGDRSVTAARRGGHVRITRRDNEPSTMATAGNLIADLREDHFPNADEPTDIDATIAKVDEIGIGRGVVDRTQEVLVPEGKDPMDFSGCAVKGINVGKKAVDDPNDVLKKKLGDNSIILDSEVYANIRAQAYWALRMHFEHGTIDIDPDDEELEAQLSDIKFKRSSNGRILIESKEHMRNRGVASPDDADAVMLSFMEAAPEQEEVDLTW